jgi:hypothetical protein
MFLIRMFITDLSVKIMMKTKTLPYQYFTTGCIHVFVSDSENAAITSIRNNNQLVFVTETVFTVKQELKFSVLCTRISRFKS